MISAVFDFIADRVFLCNIRYDDFFPMFPDFIMHLQGRSLVSFIHADEVLALYYCIFFVRIAFFPVRSVIFHNLLRFLCLWSRNVPYLMVN